MKRDLLFDRNEFIFSYRVGGVLIYDDKILLQKPENDDYAIIGGHVTSMETTADALIREYKEELRADISIERLMAVGEIFFLWDNRPCHQICLYYKCRLNQENAISLEGCFYGYDDLNHKRMDMKYCWVPLEQLRKGLKVYPSELVPHILSRGDKIEHFVSSQI